MTSLVLPRSMPRRAAPTPRPQRAGTAPARAGWLQRLAAWADRQPPHHRMGSWTAL